MPLASLVEGIALGLTFHPVWALGGVALGILLLWIAEGSRYRWVAALVATLAAWVLGNASDLGDAVGAGADGVMLVTWCVVGFGIGHVVPLLAGHAVGSRVFRGTGWLSALAIGIAVAWALSLAGGPIGEWLAGLPL